MWLIENDFLNIEKYNLSFWKFAFLAQKQVYFTGQRNRKAFLAFLHMIKNKTNGNWKHNKMDKISQPSKNKVLNQPVC